MQPCVLWLGLLMDVYLSILDAEHVAWQPYTLNEITRDDLATEFAFQAYSEWDGTGEIYL